MLFCHLNFSSLPAYLFRKGSTSDVLQLAILWLGNQSEETTPIAKFLKTSFSIFLSLLGFSDHSDLDVSWPEYSAHMITGFSTLWPLLTLTLIDILQTDSHHLLLLTLRTLMFTMHFPMKFY